MRDDIMYPQTLANELGLSRNVVYRELRKGTIPSLKVGDRYVISRAIVEQLLRGELIGRQAPGTLMRAAKIPGAPKPKRLAKPGGDVWGAI
jgi:excisionase family DNA binding protein